MQSAGNRLAFLKEYPGSGHSVSAKEHKSIVKWVLEQKRDPAPRSIAIDCETPTLERHAYIQILEFDDPHPRAILTTRREGGVMIIDPQNVATLTVDI